MNNFPTPHEERLAWAKLIWNIELHPGQKNVFLAKNARTSTDPSRGVMRMEKEDRRWGKTFLIAVDAVTTFLQNPELRQLCIFPNRQCSQMFFEIIAKLINDARDRPDVLSRFPQLEGRSLSKSEHTLFIHREGRYHARIAIASVDLPYHVDKFTGLELYDRLYVDNSNFLDARTLSRCLDLVKPGGETLLMACGRAVSITNPLLSVEEIKAAARFFPTE